MISKVLDRQVHPRLRAQHGREARCIVSGASGIEQTVVILDHVGHAEIVKRREPAQTDGGEQANLIGNVAVAERIEISIVAPVRRCGETEQEPRS